MWKWKLQSLFLYMNCKLYSKIRESKYVADTNGVKMSTNFYSYSKKKLRYFTIYKKTYPMTQITIDMKNMLYELIVQDSVRRSSSEEKKKCILKRNRIFLWFHHSEITRKSPHCKKNAYLVNYLNKCSFVGEKIHFFKTFSINFTLQQIKVIV